MTIEENRNIYQRLSEDCTTRQSIDDPVFSPRQIFQSVTFSYNNEHIILQLPDDMFNVDVNEDIDANDCTCINITRDVKFNKFINCVSCLNDSPIVYILCCLIFSYLQIRNWIKHVWDNTMGLYKVVLKELHKGTGGGLGLTKYFEG